MNEKQMINICNCGAIPSMFSYHADNEKWYYIQCKKCKMRTKMDYNIQELTINVWNSGYVELDIKDGLISDIVKKELGLQI